MGQLDEIRSKIVSLIKKLNEDQLVRIEKLTYVLNEPYIKIESATKMLTDRQLNHLGDTLKLHHAFSSEAFSKDKFEYAFSEVFRLLGIESSIAPKTNPGLDVVINSKRFSLKTEAAKSIKKESIHISKFMELGKGEWDVNLLADQFIDHMSKYDSIITLRCFRNAASVEYHLVELPINEFKQCKKGEIEESTKSRQDPKPASLHYPNKENKIYSLYFDGGTERKLQIKNIDTRYCALHAMWEFPIDKY